MNSHIFYGNLFSVDLNALKSVVVLDETIPPAVDVNVLKSVVIFDETYP